jgi:anti-anti-sigma factor
MHEGSSSIRIDAGIREGEGVLTPQFRKQGDVMIVNVHDHLLDTAAVAFEEHLLGVIDAGERRVLVDCSELEYVNSGGMKAFHLAARKLEMVGGCLIVCSLRPSVLMIFEMIGFTRIMTIASNREEALRAFAAPPTS